MYKVFVDGTILYDPRVDELAITDPQIDMEPGKVGAFDFVIPQQHPLFDKITRLQSQIEVYQDDRSIFRGRVLDDKLDFYNNKEISCEGELAYLNDSVVRPYSYKGSVRGYLQLLVNQHNKQVEERKRFVVGVVTVTDPNDYITREDTTYPNTWEVLQDKLVERLGGYMILRRENDTNYIDYLIDATKTSGQVLRIGENLLDVDQLKRGGDIATAIIPLGASDEETEQRLTIASVNGGKDYVYDKAAVERYGWIFHSVEFDDVHTPSILKKRGEEELAQAILTDITIELSAIDLSLIDKTIDQFRVFEYVRVDSEKHGLQRNFLVTHLSIHLTDPAQTKLTLGQNIRTFTEKQLATTSAVRVVGGAVQNVTPVVQTVQKELGTVYNNMSFSEIGNSVGVGMPAPDAEGFEIAWNITAHGNLALEGIIENEAPTEADLLNSWQNYDVDNYAAASFWKDKNGIVHLTGHIKSGTVTTGTVLFILPQGYRPASGEVLAAWSPNGYFRLDVLANGQVMINGTGASNSLVSLAGITFAAKLEV